MQRWFEQRTEAGDPWRPEVQTKQIVAGDVGRFVDKDDLVFMLNPGAPDVALNVELEGLPGSETRNLPAGTLVAAYALFLDNATGFEQAAGFDQFDYVPGALDGQSGWTVSDGADDVVVQNAVASTGDGAVALTPTSGSTVEPVIINSPASYATGTTDARITVGFDFQVTTSSAAFAEYEVVIGGSEPVLVFNLNGPVGAIGYGDPSLELSDPFSYELDAWHRLEMTLDFATQSADVFLDGRLIAKGLPFATTNQVLGFSGIEWRRLAAFVPAADTLYLDTVAVRADDASGAELYATRSDDYGESWSTPVKLSGASEVNQGVCLAAQGDEVMAVWRRFRPPGNTDPSQTDALLYAMSSDRGATWSPPQSLPELCPFDQPALNDRFRINSFPTVVSDGKNSA